MSLIKITKEDSKFDVNSHKFSRFESMIKSRSIDSRELIIWFRNMEEFDTKKFFWCNETMSSKLGLSRNEKGLILTNDYYELFVMDAEGKALIEELKLASSKVRSSDINITESYIAKVRSKSTNKLVYLHFILEVFERYPDGSIKTWGGNGIDVSDVYINDNQTTPKKIKIGSIQYNVMTNQLYNGLKKIDLNPVESRIFLLLVEANEELVTYEKMMKYMDYSSVSSMMDFVKVYIHRLRRKLGILECSDVKILSHYSKGYSLEIIED